MLNFAQVFMTSLTLAISWPLLGMSQTEEWTEQDWKPLVNEPSRQHLLQLTKPAGLKIEAVPSSFKFPQNAVSTLKVPRVYGIDISHYSPSTIPFAKLRSQKIQYVYCKATQGVGFKDSKFGMFWKALGALPSNQIVLRGAYHFLSSSVNEDATLQAERFVAYVNLQGGFKANDLPPVVDLEWDFDKPNGTDRWQFRSPTDIVNTVLDFMRRVEILTGKAPMLYTTRAWWRDRKIPESAINKFSHYTIWIADYSNATLANEKPLAPNNVKPALWQFSDNAKITAEPTSSYDANIFSGTEDDFLHTFFRSR